MSLFVSQDVYNSFVAIINDRSFKTSQYKMTPSRLKTNIDAKIIKMDIALNMVNLFNAYYNTSYELEDLFNAWAIKNYAALRWSIDYGYWDAGQSWYIEWFLRIVKTVIWALWNVITFPIKVATGYGERKEDDTIKFFIAVTAILIVVFLLPVLIPYIYNLIWYDYQEGSNIYESINSMTGR